MTTTKVDDESHLLDGLATGGMRVHSTGSAWNCVRAWKLVDVDLRTVGMAVFDVCICGCPVDSIRARALGVLDADVRVEVEVVVGKRVDLLNVLDEHELLDDGDHEESSAEGDREDNRGSAVGLALKKTTN